MSEGSSYFRRKAKVMCLLLALMGVFGTAESLPRAWNDRAFSQHAKPALALPETNLPESTTASSEVSLSYDLGNRLVTAKPIRIGQDRLETLRHGGRLEIVYLPDSPRTIRFPDWEPELAPPWVGPLLTVMGIVGFAVFARPRR